MKTVAIIPARGGSKRIPGKNIKIFAGLPMIAHSIRAAQKAGVFDRVLVSTDSGEVMKIAQQHGAETPFKRPAELADDVAGTDEVIVHALEWLAAHDWAASYACCIYATAPLIRAEYIQQGLKQLRTHHATTAFSVTTYPYPILRSLKLDDRGRMVACWPESFARRSQDLPESFHDAGQFYWCDVEKYLREKQLLSCDALPIFIPRCLVQDIDTREDWEVAERMFAAAKSNGKDKIKFTARPRPSPGA